MDSTTRQMGNDGDLSGSGRSHDLIASDRVAGTDVRRTSGDKIGTIERVLIEKASGKVRYAVMSFGGILGLGEEYHTLPWSTLTYNPLLAAYEVNVTDEQLRDAPRRLENGDPSSERAWEEHVHKYFNAPVTPGSQTKSAGSDEQKF